MATVEEEDLPPRNVRFATVRDMAGRTWEEAIMVEEQVSKTVYGRAGQPLWPVLLLLGILLAFVAGGPSASALGALATALLLVWTIGHR